MAPPVSIPAIAAALGPDAVRFDIDVLATCASTNSELLARAEAGAPSGSVVVAERQTAGRGRMGRAWLSAPGDSLTFSLLWRFAPDSPLSGLSLAVGVALVRALEKVSPRDTAAIGLKWPNDVLLDGRKLAGVLIELQSNGVAVIGIGINLRLPPDLPAEVRANAAVLGSDIDANGLLGALLVELRVILEQFPTPGFAALRDDWQARHAWSGRPVRVQSSPATAIEGRCAGVDPDGALLLETPAGIQRILSGDVSLRLT